MGRKPPRAYLAAKAAADLRDTTVTSSDEIRSQPAPRKRQPFTRRTYAEIEASLEAAARIEDNDQPTATCACSPPWRSAGCKLHGVTTPGNIGGPDWVALRKR